MALLKGQLEEHIEKYNRYRILIHHPTIGMASTGYYCPEHKDYHSFTPEQIKEVAVHIDEMLDFYEELLEQQ